MRALVISGGGSKGAFAGGVAEYLITRQKHNYDIFVGSSTGSLMMPHLALGQLYVIKEAYTSVESSDIFSEFPFEIVKEDNDISLGIDIPNVVKNLKSGSNTFGESGHLLEYIRKTLSREDYKTLEISGKKVVVAVSNITKNSTEYKYVSDFDYDEFCEWIWISCNYTPFMSLIRKNGCDYADGGLGMNVPLEKAVDMGATEIDVVILNPKSDVETLQPSKNAFSLLNNLFSYLIDRVESQNIADGIAAAKAKGANLNFYHTPKSLISSPLIFHKTLMKSWWDLGFSTAQRRHEKI